MIAGAAPTPAQRDHAGDDGGAQNDLQAAQAEHQPAHGHQTLEGQLQADQEQQEDDAELGEWRTRYLRPPPSASRAKGRSSLKEPRPSGPRIAPAPR